jgi:DNA-binding PadR family transcriptional regulator
MSKRTMQEATFLILTALAGGSQPGYGIITDVEQISKRRVRLRAGTLYTALDPIESGQFVAVTPDSARHIRAGENGLVFIAVCAART